MLSFRNGRIVLQRLSNSHDLSRNYSSPRHKEPKDLSWQWSVKKNPELMNCKDINIQKTCPKPSFFPRFKKVFVPADQKACERKKPQMTWKEYWSFLLPDQVNRPPLIQCRKLQAQRRKCCGGPMSCPDEGTQLNCCPPPKEWYGQAEIFVVPSSLPPIGESQFEPEPCAPTPPSEPSCVLALKGECPIPKKVLNMDDYAYKKAFSGVNLCDEVKEIQSSFKLKGDCVPQLPEGSKSLRLSCVNFSEFKEVECPKAIATTSTTYDMPPLVCKNQEEGVTEEKKEINVEIKKGVCGRQTFLKPYKYGDKVPERKEIHTQAFMKHETKAVSNPLRSFYSTSQAQMKKYEAEEISKQELEPHRSGPEVSDISNRVRSENICQPSKSAVGLHHMLLKPLSGRLRDGLHAPPSAYHIEDSCYKRDSQEIDPELSKLAETTKKNMTYGLSKIPSEKEKTTTTLAKELSKIAEERFIKKAKEKGIDRKPTSPAKNYFPPSKLTLLKKKKNPAVVSTQATFMTEAMINIKAAKKKDKQNKKDEKNIICSGCPGIKAAEEEERNPMPKPAINCKGRPSGRCRGPQRKVFPDEGEPQNPYSKCKKKPYSLCNQPRPVIKKKERPYKMPCEDNMTKRKFHLFSASREHNISNTRINKFHSTTCLNDSEINITTIYDLVKLRGLNKADKLAHNQSNDWDSHTSDSYGERGYEEYDSLPDLSKYQSNNNDNGIKKMSYPVNLWESPDNKNKSNYNSWSNEGNKTLMGSNGKETINNNVVFIKRKPSLNLTKDSNNNVKSPPSKYNVLFNPIFTKNQTESTNQNTNFFMNKSNNQENKFKSSVESKEKNFSNSKTTEYINSENKVALNAAPTKEMSSFPITTHNMWLDSINLPNEQNLPSVSLVSQEMKTWEKEKSHTLLKDDLMSECSTHNMFGPIEESKKVSTKPENDVHPIFYQEKMLLSGPGNIENKNNINEGKQD